MISADNSLTVENNCKACLYHFRKKGIPLVSNVERVEKGLTMKVDYVTMDLKPVDQKSLVQGSDFMMIVKVTIIISAGLRTLHLPQWSAIGLGNTEYPPV